jgi:diadenosine tetraphosphate (Ap4A) HIT family hydrolase
VVERERKAKAFPMNPTIEKFGYPTTVIREYAHWVVLLRPSQVTLGSLVLAAKSDATAYSDLEQEALVEQWGVVGDIERSLKTFVDYERINYLMLMMVDPQVHFHVIPRYPGVRVWNDLAIDDTGWPKFPDLAAATTLTDRQLAELTAQLQKIFC